MKKSFLKSCELCGNPYSVKINNISICKSCAEKSTIRINAVLDKKPEVINALNLLKEKRSQLMELIKNEGSTLDYFGTPISRSSARKTILEINTQLNEIEMLTGSLKERRDMMQEI